MRSFIRKRNILNHFFSPQLGKLKKNTYLHTKGKKSCRSVCCVKITACILFWHRTRQKALLFKHTFHSFLCFLITDLLCCSFPCAPSGHRPSAEAGCSFYQHEILYTASLEESLITIDSYPAALKCQEEELRGRQLADAKPRP